MLGTASIAEKWGKVKSSDPDKLHLTLHAMLRSLILMLKAMDSSGRVVGTSCTFRIVNCQAFLLGEDLEFKLLLNTLGRVREMYVLHIF